MLHIEDDGRVRVLTLDRPDALNAFNEALYDAVTDALIAAADDNDVAVVVITGRGRAFSAGQDLLEMATRASGADFENGRHGFPGLIDQLADFPKPLILAINGLGLGLGATMVGFADLVFMADDARLKCPFTSLAVAPEAASSELFPRLLGRQQASWVLMSSEWIDAEQCRAMGLVFEVCPADELIERTMDRARVLAAAPVVSLVETKATITASIRPAIEAARDRENAAFARLMGGPANMEALAAFAEKRPPDFSRW